MEGPLKPLAGLIDTHCHLDAAEFDGDRETVAASARAAGVELMVVPAVELANFEAVERMQLSGELAHPPAKAAISARAAPAILAAFIACPPSPSCRG